MPFFSQKLSIQIQSIPQLILEINAINISPSKYIQKPVENNYSQWKKFNNDSLGYIKIIFTGGKKKKRKKTTERATLI